MKPMEHGIEPGVFIGKVVHRRLRPVMHELEYRVASLLVDVDRLESGLPSLLRYNGFGLFSIDDRDHGHLGATQSIKDFAWGEMRDHPDVKRIMMLCYPRMLGYTFNPLTVFFGLDDDGHVRMQLFAVHNTFGGRHIYRSGPFAATEQAFTSTEKVFRVSPFNKIEGHYGLRASIPAADVTVGVALTTDAGPVLKAYFTGKRQPLSNAVLLRVFIGFPFMTLKVMTAIHWEALKLWIKGLKLQSP
jgi:uncharacterized protein